jgi:hypothetical protein
MKMNYKAFQDIELSRLGMGNMRLPAVNPKDPKSPIDWEKAHEIIDYAIANGITYYDTAYVYNGGESEKCLGAALKKYPRDQYYIATKFNLRANPDYRAVFEEQLERLQTDHIDFYLCHCLLDNNVDGYLESGCIEYFLEQKEKGRIRYLGFSSHAGLDALKKFADHHAWDFAQLQINYFDWNYAKTKEEYQILADRNIPIMVMEPVRGGRLSKLTPDAEALLQKAHPDWSISSWALRFARSLPQVQVVLSGMSSMDQIMDNIGTFSSPEIFTPEDEKILFEACDLFKKQLQVPCTACRYCCDDCPMQINIPEFLKVYNDYKVNGRGALKAMENIETEGKPADCIGCGSCTGHCPQSIQVPDIMAELATLS